MWRVSFSWVLTVFVVSCGGASPEPAGPVGRADATVAGEQPQAAQADLGQRLLAAMASCEARARCCPAAGQTAEACETELGALREAMQGMMSSSQLLATGAASLDESAIRSLEGDVASCRPHLAGDAFLASLVAGTVPEGGHCGEGNPFDAAACQDGLTCDFASMPGSCARQAEGAAAARMQTVEETYCPRP